MRTSEYDEDLYIKTSVGKVPVYKFIEKFLKIETKDGSIVPFKLNEEQWDLYKDICEQRRKGTPVRTNILKGRQMGFSTFIAGLIFTLTIFQAGKKSIIVADEREHAQDLLKKYNTFYNFLPEELQLKKVSDSKDTIAVQYPSKKVSLIKVVTQGDKAGRSGTYQYAHFSECAFWADLKKTLNSALQTISGANKDSMVFLETTANGFNEYKQRYDRDATGSTSFKALFYPWFMHKEYVRKYTNFALMEHEQKAKEKYNLSNEQIAFYREMYNTSGELDMLRQEYPCNPQEAFVTSGHGVFNAEYIQLRKEELFDKNNSKKGFFSYTHKHSIDGQKIEMTEIKFNEAERGKIRIFKEAEKGHPYIINLDPSMGGEDYACIQVLNNYTMEQVAVLHEQKMDDDELAYTMYCLGKHYNDALICAETNNPNGAYILQMCEKMGYKNIYIDKDFESITERYQMKFGYKTKQNNKNVMVSLLKVAFRDNYRFINDYETLCEMEQFQIYESSTGKEQFRAGSGSHDDLVTSLMGCFYIRDGQSYLPTQLEEKNKDEKSEEDPFFIKKDKKERGFIIWD